VRAQGGGGGRTRVLQNGRVFEKAGVNVSIVKSKLSKGTIAQMKSRGKEIYGAEAPFYACGISLVLHPHNPMAPTVHANFRYFEVESRNGEGRLIKTSWFGGGADLTPAYLFDEDAVHFHKTWKRVCDKHNKAYYPEYKKWCDNYFNLTHRKERRGVGGIFFDDLEVEDMREALNFVSDAAHDFLPAYMPIVKRRKDMAFTAEQKRWQQLRRARYVEFNLVHDRGTKFGLAMPNSRIESILVSMPLTARWEYCHEPASGTPEARLVEVLRNPVEWIDE
jgi:coproporphyrinogen III oxidase